MSEQVSDRAAALVTGSVGLVFSLAYIKFAGGIEDSLLADAVGASGVPVSVGTLMAAASAALLLKGFLLVPPVQRTSEAVSSTVFDSRVEVPQPAHRPHWLAAGLLLILAVYLLVLPWLGYIVSIGLLSTAVAWFAGGRQPKVLLGFALFTGPFLWFLFDFALKVRMPAGVWSAVFSG